MKSIRVQKIDLLRKLDINRTKHKEDFEAASIGYKKALKKCLMELLGSIETDTLDRSDLNEIFQISCPKSHEEEYNVVIEMMKMSDDNVVEITAEEFRQYVRDDWNWKPDFNTTKRTYGVS